MAPPKSKLYAKTGKLKTINSSATPSTTEPTNPIPSTPAASASDTEAERQLELELCWCIQTMETTLQSGKLNAKQAQDTEKTIKLLKSGNQPIIKKRQIMRAAFGDYRAKMAEEERKLRLKGQQIQFTSNDSTPSTAVRSHFVKKSALQSLGEEFRFEFQVADRLTQLDINQTTDQPRPATSAQQSNDNAPVQSIIRSRNNSFRFNFNVDPE